MKCWDYKLENQPKFSELHKVPSRRKSHSDETVPNAAFGTLIFQQNVFFSLTMSLPGTFSEVL